VTAPRVRILLATRNAGKVREVRGMLSGFPVEIVSLLDLPEMPDVVEDGTTFQENALKKARELARRFPGMVVADDSGLEVDALQGGPGVRSARYAGEKATDPENNRKLLDELISAPEKRRTARFRCVLALVQPDGREWIAEGSCEGRIASEPRGNRGFGYDPVFLVPELGKTFAELTTEEKNRISHRARALAALRATLEELLNNP
jgi:XTP/dITP diphosphohydrolase